MAAKKAGKKVTAKSVIENGIKSGWTIARIVKTVKAKVPGSKITEQVVRVYASTMHKNGDITLEQKNKYLIRKKGDKPKAVVKKKKVAPKKKAGKKAASKKKVAKKKAVKKSKTK